MAYRQYFGILYVRSPVPRPRRLTSGSLPKLAPTLKPAERQRRHYDATGQRRYPHDVEEGAYGRFGPSAVNDGPGSERDQKISATPTTEPATTA